MGGGVPTYGLKLVPVWPNKSLLQKAIAVESRVDTVIRIKESGTAIVNLEKTQRKRQHIRIDIMIKIGSVIRRCFGVGL